MMGDRGSQPTLPDARKTLLVLDDRPAERLLLVSTFEGRYRVIEATDADSAIRGLKRNTVDLLLLDLHLPPRLDSPIGGQRVLERVRALRPDAPVVIVTANGDPLVRERALRMGARAFLTKPFDVDELVRMVEELLGG